MIQRPGQIRSVSGAALIILIALACTVSLPPAANAPGSGSPSEAAAPNSSLPEADINGVWASMEADTLRNVLVFSGSSMYWVRPQEAPSGGGGQSAVREQFAVITSQDSAAGQLTFKISWIRVNGQFGGFDAPSWFASYEIQGDTLKIAVSDLGFPTLDDAEVYFRQ